MILFPPAKINLGLQIHSKRSDGFHEIETCMVPIPFYDILEVTLSAVFSFEQTGIKIPGVVGENLCEKAFFFMKTRYSIGNVRIHLRKQIPIGAGLGGGSSNAAHVLLALNELFNLKLTLDKLCRIAEELGSDCPFFIQNKIQIAKGRGELLTPISMNLIGIHCVLFNPNIHVSTKEAYSNVIPKKSHKNLSDLLSLPFDKWNELILNDFEESVFKSHPEIQLLKKELLNSAAFYCSLSGSGATVFAFFKSSKEVPTILSNRIIKEFTWHQELSFDIKN